MVPIVPCVVEGEDDLELKRSSLASITNPRVAPISEEASTNTAAPSVTGFATQPPPCIIPSANLSPVTRTSRAV